MSIGELESQIPSGTLLQEPEEHNLSPGEDENSDEENYNVCKKVKYCYPISKQLSDKIYEFTGEKLKITEPRIPFVLSDRVKVIIEETVQELGLGFNLNDMQLRSVHAIATGQDLILISPCGTGKMLVFFLAVAVLRKIKNMPNGVGYILEPLVAISEDMRSHDPPLPVVVLDNLGVKKPSENDKSNVTIEEIVEGKYPCIFISAESVLSPEGRSLMRKLRKQTILVCTDEAHLFTNDQWGHQDFRQSMSQAPGVLAAQTRSNKGLILLYWSR